jgi:hypothetical protein
MLTKESSIISLKGEKYNEGIKEEPGIYKIFMVDGKMNPIPTSRYLSQDKNGILYIGSTDNVQRRLAEIKKSLPYPKNEKEVYISDCHQFGRKAKLIKKLKIESELNSIRVEVCYTDNFLSEEASALEEYFQDYGELPPFNDKFGSWG